MTAADTPACKHPECEARADERLAVGVVSSLTGASFQRVCERATVGPKPDYRSAAEYGDPVSVEVKQLTSGTMRRHIADRAKHIGSEPFHPAPSLSSSWFVMIDTTSAHGTFDANGMSPRLDTLLKNLTIELKRLEASGETDGGNDPAIRRLTHSWVCAAVPNSPRGPGIIISESHGGSRSTDIEIDVVEFVSQWLSSERSEKLRSSLRGERGQRIAALVADTSGPAGGMIRTLNETSGAPRTPLPMPAEIDAIVLIAGNEVLDYGFADGWRSRSLRSCEGA